MDRVRPVRLAAIVWLLTASLVATTVGDDATDELSQEVAGLGWVVFCARTTKGDWDVMLCRPNGSAQRNLTSTSSSSEFAPQFSRDGSRILFRRVPLNEIIDGNDFGTQGRLVISNSDGSESTEIGADGEYSWATWSAEGNRIICLARTGFSEVDLDSRRVIRRWPRRGFFQQIVCRADGKMLCGVSNSFGGGWSVGSYDLASESEKPVSAIHCCTPDWFPDGKSIIFSRRPEAQKENDGYGWTQLWRSNVDGSERNLVYGENGRHVYGGRVSPDGKYVLFTGNMREDGDPQRAGGPMGLMRLSDAPIVAGDSPALRALHPQAGRGPVVVLPNGWEPDWTLSEAPAKSRDGVNSAGPPMDSAGEDISVWANELKRKGWIVFSGANARGDWDLYRIRPDGTGTVRVTNTPQWNEAGARFSPTGQRLLYYRIPREEIVDNNNYGTYELIISESTGEAAQSYGTEYHWAAWGPEGKTIACLTGRSIQVVDVSSGKRLRAYPRNGIVQQLSWSPDGQRFTGTANGLGPYWNIGVVSAGTGVIRAFSETDRYNCTPDWAPDSRTVIYARGIVPEVGGFAELWSTDGDHRERLFASLDQHVYGACSSPDGQHLLFTLSQKDMGGRDSRGAKMCIIRWPHPGTQAARPHSVPRAKTRAGRAGPVWELRQGWEPHWTDAELNNTSATTNLTE